MGQNSFEECEQMGALTGQRKLEQLTHRDGVSG